MAMAPRYNQSTELPSDRAPSLIRSSDINMISNIINIAIGPLVLILTLFSVVAYLQWRHPRGSGTQVGNVETHEMPATTPSEPIGELRQRISGSGKRQAPNVLEYAVVEPIDRYSVTSDRPTLDSREDTHAEALQAGRVK